MARLQGAHRCLLPCLVAAALSLAAAPVSAALYKWLDSNGHWVYSDQPPPPNVKSEQIKGAPPPANPNAAKEPAQKESEFRKRQTDKTTAADKTAREKALADRRTEACTQVKRQIAELDNTSISLYRLNEKGERETLDEAGRARERAKLDAFAKENCQGV
ncbi:MAG TPA: DUF4124 domain-containing protein [Casimicrobiaceae bacterium]|nr:DUF4124 domain-containing protein [Casimicrobiaceae bacterium]